MIDWRKFLWRKRPDVSICLLTWNRARFLDVCLREMFAALTPTEKGGLSREIIIMDNASDDDTPKITANYADRPGVKVVRNKKNLRFAAYKRLFFRARGRVIIDLDDDVLAFPKDFDRTLVDYLETYRDYGFLACNVVQNEKTDGQRPRDAVYTENAIASLCWRLGKRIGIIKDAVVFHASGPVYSRENGYLQRDIEKYATQGAASVAAKYVAQNSIFSHDSAIKHSITPPHQLMQAEIWRIVRYRDAA